MFWLLLEKGAGRSYVGSSSFHFSSATQPRSWIRAPLAPPRRRRRHQRLHLPCHLSSPRVSPPAPPGEIRGGFLDRGKERSATNFLKKKTSKSSGKCFSWLAGSTATASRHRCTLAIFLMEKEKNLKNNKNLQAKCLTWEPPPRPPSSPLVSPLPPEHSLILRHEKWPFDHSCTFFVLLVFFEPLIAFFCALGTMAPTYEFRHLMPSYVISSRLQKKMQRRDTKHMFRAPSQ